MGVRHSGQGKLGSKFWAGEKGTFSATTGEYAYVDASQPFIAAGRLVAACARFVAFESPRADIFPVFEKGSEEQNLVFCRRPGRLRPSEVSRRNSEIYRIESREMASKVKRQ